MELNKDYRSSDVEEMMDRESSSTDTTFNGVWPSTRFPGAVRKKAYRFDGDGNYSENEWDLSSHVCNQNGNIGKEFCWYHVELPKHDGKKLALYAQYLIDVLCPPLKLQEILALCSNGPYCGYVDGALVFRLNSPGPPGSNFTLRLAARVTKNSVITVSLGRVPRLGFSYVRNTVLSEIPTIESPGSGSRYMEDKGRGRIPIEEHVLEFFLTMNHSDQEAANPVPTTVSNLIIHIVDTHVDHVQDIVTDLEMELDSVELELDKGGYALKKQMLNDRRFAKLNLDLQRLLQVVAHGEQVFPRVKEKCAAKNMFTTEDIGSMEEIIGRLRRIKENLGYIVNRVTAVQTGLDSWQAEQLNRRLYYLSFLSMIFLPLSIITGIFGMNVGGVPWTEQKDPRLKNGFRNVLLICAALFFTLLFGFSFRALYWHISSWRTQQTSFNRTLSSFSRKTYLKRLPYRNRYPGTAYVQV